MKSKKRVGKPKKKGLLFPFAGEENEKLGRDFFKSPDKFLKEAGLTWEDLECPEEVHQAFKRAKAFEKDVKRADIKPEKKSIDELKKIASKHFGKDFDVSIIPFGLKFRENIKIDHMADWTATGTASVTFLDTDADTDS